MNKQRLILEEFWLWNQEIWSQDGENMIYQRFNMKRNMWNISLGINSRNWDDGNGI